MKLWFRAHSEDAPGPGNAGPPPPAAGLWAARRHREGTGPEPMHAPDLGKLADLAHYVIWRAAGPEGFEAPRLFQVLWCAEIHNYIHHGRLISGAKYVRSRQGLRPICWDEVSDLLVESRRVRCWAERRPEGRVTRFSAERRPQRHALARSEMAAADYWIENPESFLGGQRSAVFRGAAG